jgi:hypothetical protein
MLVVIAVSNYSVYRMTTLRGFPVPKLNMECGARSSGKQEDEYSYYKANSIFFSNGWGGISAIYIKLRTIKPKIDPGINRYIIANSDSSRCILGLVEGI